MPAMDDNSSSPEQWEAKGALAPHVENVVMKVLSVARLCRWYLFWTVNWLAAGLAYDEVEVEPSVRRKAKTSLAYMKATEALVMQSYVNGPTRPCNVAVFSDADLPGVWAQVNRHQVVTSQSWARTLGRRLPGYTNTKRRRAIAPRTPRYSVSTSCCAPNAYR